MKFSIVLSGAAAAALVASAAAAQTEQDCFDKGDLTYFDCPTEPEPVIEEPAALAPLGPNWTGFYIGAHAGYASADVDGRYASGFFDVPALELNGGLAGGQVGYLYQYDNNIVTGVEFDLSGVWADDTVTNVGGFMDAELNYLASARLRVGYAMEGGWLPYLTGGVALAGYEIFIDEEDDETADLDETAFGGVVGGGVEVMLYENWSLRAEGLYYFFDDETSLDGVTSFAEDGDFFSLEDVIVGRIGLNFRF